MGDNFYLNLRFNFKFVGCFSCSFKKILDLINKNTKVTLIQGVDISKKYLKENTEWTFIFKEIGGFVPPNGAQNEGALFTFCMLSHFPKLAKPDKKMLLSFKI